MTLLGCQSTYNPKLDLSPATLLLEQDSTLTSPFFDQGSWVGYLPQENHLGIAAPRMLSDSNGYDFHAPLLTIEIKEGDNSMESLTNHYYPGSIVQETSMAGSSLLTKGIFTDKNTFLYAVQIANDSREPKQYEICWQLPKADSLIETGGFYYDQASSNLVVHFEEAGISTESSTTTITLGAQSSKTFLLTVRHQFKEDTSLQRNPATNAAEDFILNNKRWSEYLNPYSRLPKAKRMLASKSIQTLINNWRSAAGFLQYDGLFPSYDYEWFHGFWSWDSWKHAVALVTFEPELAKEQMRVMYAFQNEEGMIPDVIYRDTTIEVHNWRDTKPPLSGWAFNEIFKADRDTSFLKEMLPKLIKYHNWWYKNRDHNQNGLCEYGSTDGTRLAAGWESGMDNAVRFDEARMVKISETAWTLDQESVDLNAYLYFEKVCIADLLQALGQQQQANQYLEEAQMLKEKIVARFYNEKQGYFYDYNVRSSKHLPSVGTEAWTVLWTKLADNEQANQIRDKIMSKAHFNTFVPLPTLSASHPKFNPRDGYWRGPVWMDQAYFALEGLWHYGFKEERNFLLEKILRNADGLLEKGGPIRENYDPRNGAGLNAKHFSWSAAHLLLLLREE